MILTGIGSTTADAATPSQLTTEAYKYIGVKYVYGGTSTSGFDCSGYTQYVYKKLGISIPRTTSSQWAFGTAISKSNLIVGDLVFFNTTGRVASHVGIFIGNGKFVHAGTTGGVQISKLSDSYWAPKYNGGRRMAWIADPAPVVVKPTPAPAPAPQPQEVKAAEIDFTVYASRGEVALKMASALGLDTSNTNSPFSDVPSTSKYAGAVTALNKAGVFTGDNYGHFNPNAPLTREEMAKILVDAYHLQHQGGNYSFTDVTTNLWSFNYIQNLASNEVTYGIGDNKYGTTRNVMYTELEMFMERAATK